MLDFIKKNSVVIIVCLVFLISGGIAISNYIKGNKLTSDSYTKINYNECLKEYEKDYCNSISNTFIRPKRDTMSTLNYIISVYFNALQFGVVLLIMIASSNIFNKYFRSGYLKNSISRIGYEASIKKIYLKTLKCACILPIFMIIMFISSYIISGNFDYKIGLYTYGFVGFSVEAAKNWPIFMIIYILNFGLNSIFWINISIWNLRHNKSTLVSIIVSFIEFFLLELILEITGTTFFKTTRYLNYFNLLNIWDFSNLPWIGAVLESLLFIVITLFMVYKAYHNKEKVMEEL